MPAKHFRYSSKRNVKPLKHHLGFTLIEMMITVAVIAILASVAYPSYTSYIRRANRVDATTALLKIAGAQEKYYLQYSTYATNTQLEAFITGSTSTDKGLYTITMPTASATDFEALATAQNSSRQFSDTSCRTFSINAAGRRYAANSATTPAETTLTCWK